MGLKSSELDRVNRSVYRQFPELNGARPSVQILASPGAKSFGGGAERHLLTYRSQVQGPGGQRIARVVRVVADDHGKILKISTSR